MAAIHFNTAPQRKAFGNRRTGARGAPGADQDIFGQDFFGCAFVMLAVDDAIGVIFVLKTLIYLLHLNP
jgi:hypothetical protein